MVDISATRWQHSSWIVLQLLLYTPWICVFVHCWYDIRSNVMKISHKTQYEFVVLTEYKFKSKNGNYICPQLNIFCFTMAYYSSSHNLHTSAITSIPPLKFPSNLSLWTPFTLPLYIVIKHINASCKEHNMQSSLIMIKSSKSRNKK